MVTETIDDVDDTDDEFDDVVFDHTGDAFVVGVSTCRAHASPPRSTTTATSSLRERLTVYITNAVLEP